MLQVLSSLSRLARLLSIALWVATVPVLALAQEDPPGRVGRLAQAEGTVWIYDADAAEWITVLPNRPLTSGDSLATDRGGRATVRFGSTALRIDAQTQIEFVQIDDHVMRIRLHAGSVAVRIVSPQAADELAVVTAEGRFSPRGPGHFRIDRRDDASAATVWQGALRFEADDSVLDIAQGQRGELWREAGRTHYTWREAEQDAFASWAAEEDRRDALGAPRYVSPEMTGSEDLARYGYWVEHSDYGAIWLPYSVPVGWAPYRFGHWVWISPWGWTWIDDAPWGFAPFHYGRWVYYRGGWGWTPGAYVAYPVYAPALVAWIGGPSFGVSVHIGDRHPPVGWFPLAPREIYVPPYRVSPIYRRNVNVTHAPHLDPADITTPARAAEFNRYANRNVPGALTLVPGDVLLRRQPVAPAARRLGGDRFVNEARRASPRIEAPITPPPRAAVPMSSPRAATPPPGVRARPDRGNGIGEQRPGLPERRGAVIAPGQPGAPAVPVQPARRGPSAAQPVMPRADNVRPPHPVEPVAPAVRPTPPQARPVRPAMPEVAPTPPQAQPVRPVPRAVTPAPPQARPAEPVRPAPPPSVRARPDQGAPTPRAEPRERVDRRADDRPADDRPYSPRRRDDPR
jgi:hypothetical protein